MPRTPIAPGIRWKVLARDGFRCRYCGAMGGDAVLVVDHAHPVARGGRNNIDNLITACEPCNQGKSDRLTMSIPEVQEYVDTAETMTGWLCDAFCKEAGVSWPPSFEALSYVVSHVETYAEAEDVVRCVASQVRDDVLSPDRHTHAQIMRAMELFVTCRVFTPEKLWAFWGDIDSLLDGYRLEVGY